MGYIYRYTDRIDGIIKYVGIVHANRSLKRRIVEHYKEDWINDSVWLIEYQEFPNMSRTDLEYLESHLISYYGTYKWYNYSKATWGLSAFAEIDEDKWIEFDDKKAYQEEVMVQRAHELNNEVNGLREVLQKVTTLLDSEATFTWQQILELEKSDLSDNKDLVYNRGKYVEVEKIKKSLTEFINSSADVNKGIKNHPTHN